MGDFGKFLLLKHLFPTESIATIWYLYPDETHNNDGSHRVEEGNTNLYRHCYALDPQMSELFRLIHQRDSVCLDPDNGIEPTSMNKLSTLKQGKYATYTEIESFFTLECVNHLVIYQHFHRQQSHEAQMREAKVKFERLYKGRAVVTIIRHNPVQARFYIVLSKKTEILESLRSLENRMYGSRAFFSVLEAMNE